MPEKPLVQMYRSMNSFPGIHPLRERSKIPLTPFGTLRTGFYTLVCAAYANLDIPLAVRRMSRIPFRN